MRYRGIRSRMYRWEERMRSIRGALLASWRSFRSVTILMAGLSVLGSYSAYAKANTVPSDQKSSLHTTDIPAGTVLPVRIGGLSSEKSKRGEIIKARIMQEVALENGLKLRAGTTVLCHAIDVRPRFPGQHPA